MSSDASPPRVVFLGDSLTEGTHGASYLAVLRSMLAQTPALSDVELINAGVGGDTVENLLRRVATDVTSHDPNWVVVLIGANDCTTWLIRRGLWRPIVFWRTRRSLPARRASLARSLHSASSLACVRSSPISVREHTRESRSVRHPHRASSRVRRAGG